MSIMLRVNREVPRVDIKTFGVYALFENLLQDEIPSLTEVFGQERAEALTALSFQAKHP
jgi:hypothetical protein